MAVVTDFMAEALSLAGQAMAAGEVPVGAIIVSPDGDIIARSELAPILNRDRGRIATDLRAQVQATLDSYNSGINIVRVNFAKADPPGEVIDAFMITLVIVVIDEGADPGSQVIREEVVF